MNTFDLITQDAPDWADRVKNETNIQLHGESHVE